MAMPEAPMHADCQAEFWKQYVWSAGQVRLVKSEPIPIDARKQKFRLPAQTARLFSSQQNDGFLPSM
jgi:hypothetical protein